MGSYRQITRSLPKASDSRFIASTNCSLSGSPGSTSRPYPVSVNWNTQGQPRSSTNRSSKGSGFFVHKTRQSAGEHIPGDAARIMAHAYVARLQPIAKPLRVIGGNIRTTARAEKHIFFLAVFPGSPQRAPLPPSRVCKEDLPPPGRDASPFPAHAPKTPSCGHARKPTPRPPSPNNSRLPHGRNSRRTASPALPLPSPTYKKRAGPQARPLVTWFPGATS